MSEVRISDNEKLFRYSGMVDALRDSAEALVRNEASVPSDRVRVLMAAQYNKLRAGMALTLREDLATEMDDQTPFLDAGQATADETYLAAVLLARFADLVHQTDRFLLSEKANAVSMAEIGKKIESEDLRGMASLLTGSGELEASSLRSESHGMYL